MAESILPAPDAKPVAPDAKEKLIAGINKELLDAHHAYAKALAQKTKADAMLSEANATLKIESGNIEKLKAQIGELYK